MNLPLELLPLAEVSMSVSDLKSISIDMILLIVPRGIRITYAYAYAGFMIITSRYIVAMNNVR